MRHFLKHRLLQKYLPYLMRFSIVYFLMIPVLFYYFFFAADRYVSEMILSVRATNGDIAPIPGVAGLANLFGSSGAGREDVLFLQDYIHSLDMLKALDAKINLRELYQKQKMDLFFKLPADATQDDFLEFYQNRVQVVFKTNSSVLDLKVEGFSPQDAQLIAQAIQDESERFINEISHKVAREQLSFAEQELLKAKDRMQNAKNALLAFQNKYGIFDPLKQAEAKASLTAGIEEKIAQKETELLTMQSYLNESAPQIVLIKSEIAALKKQLNKEFAKIASSKSARKLNELAAKFQDLALEAQFAQDAYKVTLASIEKTRVESVRKIKQLIVIQSPTNPESAMYPRTLYNIVTIFIILSLLFGIAKLVHMIIEEHRY